MDSVWFRTIRCTNSLTYLLTYLFTVSPYSVSMASSMPFPCVHRKFEVGEPFYVGGRSPAPYCTLTTAYWDVGTGGNSMYSTRTTLSKVGAGHQWNMFVRSKISLRLLLSLSAVAVSDRVVPSSTLTNEFKYTTIGYQWRFYLAFLRCFSTCATTLWAFDEF